MKAIIESNVIKNDLPIFTKKLTVTEVFFAYLTAINNASNVITLKSNVSAIEFAMRYHNVNNPFSSGFAEDGFSVFYSRGNERVIFVECEADLEV